MPCIVFPFPEKREGFRKNVEEKLKLVNPRNLQVVFKSMQTEVDHGYPTIATVVSSYLQFRCKTSVSHQIAILPLSTLNCLLLMSVDVMCFANQLSSAILQIVEYSRLQ